MDELDAVCRNLANLVASAPTPLRRIRLRSGTTDVEVEWPEAQGTIAPPAARPEPADDTAVHYLAAPMVGTFYLAPEPGAPPFVREGDEIRPGQQVAILEAMKMMMPVEADRAGQVMAVLAADAVSVEYGERLFAISVPEPA